MKIFRRKRDGLIRRVRNLMAHSGELSSLSGDLDEIYPEIAAERGRCRAGIWLWRQILGSLGHISLKSMRWGLIMLKNYLRLTLRGIRRRKLHSAVNILGLSAGLASCALIYLFIADELSFDRFHLENSRLHRLVRVLYSNADGSERLRDPSIQPAVGPLIAESYPEIEYQTRWMERIGIVRRGDRLFRETLHLVDADFFRMFTFPLIEGDLRTALAREDAVVLTRASAMRYFGRTSAVGKTLALSIGGLRRDFLVTGVAEDPPRNSTLRFDFLIRIENTTRIFEEPRFLEDLSSCWFPVYVKLRENASAADLEPKFHAFTSRYLGERLQAWRSGGRWTRESHPFSFGLQRMRDVHLGSGVYGSRGPSSILILAGIGLAVLAIACINYINLSIGLASARAREIGLRRVVGANRGRLMRQFWTESVMTTTIAMLGALLLAAMLLPRFNVIVAKQFSLRDFLFPSHLLAFLLITITVGVLAGSYPALVLARIHPAEIFRGRVQVGGRNRFTRILIGLQFALCVSLIAAASILGSQLRHLVGKDLGYEKANLVTILIQERGREDSRRFIRRFREEARRFPGVENMSACHARFGLSKAPRMDNGRKTVHFNMVDPAFFSTLGIEISEGRVFREESRADEGGAIVNQTFVRTLGIKNPVGTTVGAAVGGMAGFPDDMKPLRIIGVVDDFNFGPLDYRIIPAIFYVRADRSYTRMLVRLKPGRVKETLASLKETWGRMQPDKPFTYMFHDESLARLYQSERRWSGIISTASGLAVLIAGIGIFGLTALILNRRVKEIGIRKVLGAGIPRILQLVLGEFALLVAVSNLIAWPVIYLIMHGILQNYPFRIGIGIHHFLLAGGLSLLVAVLTISGLTLRAAAADPVKALRDE